MNPFQDAFISYGRADSRDFAQRLRDRLATLGYTVWFDFEDIPLGVDYQKQIDDGIEKADNFLFIISPHSVNSPYCGLEIDQALKYQKRIIPILHVESIGRETWQQRYPDGTNEQWEAFKVAGKHDHFINMHPEIRKINWVKCRDGVDDFETALQGIVKLMERQRDYVHQHSVLLNAALKWEQHQRQTRYLLTGEERQQAEAWLLRTFEEEQAPCLPTDLHCAYIAESIKNANNLMTDVFLCHAEEDRAIAEQVRRSLARACITTWTHHGDIEFGTDFQAAMGQGMEEADNVVLLISPRSLASSYCQQELNHALSLHKRIIPLLVETVSPDQIPPALQTLQYIDLTDNQSAADYQQDESDLLRILKQDAAYHHEHKVLLTKALKWERQQRNPSILLRGYELRHAEAWLKLSRQYPSHPPVPLQREFITESQRQPSGMNLDVFISYSRTDADFARKLNDALQRQGKRTWFDQESIASGADFQQEIYRGIEASDHFLFILSPRAVTSPHCAGEVEYAAKLNKRILTVRHRSVDAGDLHPELAKVQWIDFQQKDADFAANFQELLRTLDVDPDHLRFHTQLLTQAIAWEERGRRYDRLLRGVDLMEAEQWLLQAAGKQPSPTQLQGEYVAASRQTSVNRQRSLVAALGSLLAAAVIGIWLAVMAQQRAVNARQQAEAAQQEAEVAKLDAINQKNLALAAQKETEQALTEAEAARDEAEAAQQKEKEQRNQAERAKAQEAVQRQQAILAQQEAEANARQAVTNAKEAEKNAQEAADNAKQAKENAQKADERANEVREQIRIGLARQLAAEAAVLQQTPGQFTQSTLLAIEALNRLEANSLPTFDAKRVLNALRSMPLAQAHILGNEALLSTDGKTILIPNASGVQLWDVATQRQIPLPTDEIMKFSLPNTYGGGVIGVLSSASTPPWEVANDQEVSSLFNNAWLVSLSSSGRYVFLPVEKGNLVWDLETQQMLTIPVEDAFISDLSRNDRYLLLRSEEDNRLWDLETQQIILPPKTGASVMEVSHDGRYALLASQINSSETDNYLWDLETQQMLASPLENTDMQSLSSDGRYVVIQGENGYLLWQPETQQIIEPPVDGGFSIRPFDAFSPNSRYVVIQNEMGEALWDLETQQVITPSSESALIITFTPDSRYAVIADETGESLLWNLETQEITLLPIEDIFAVAPVSDGHTLFIQSYDSSLLWNTDTSQTLTQVQQFEADQLTFSPNGQYLAIESPTDTRLWDVETNQEIPLPAENISDLFFYEDSHTLNIQSGDEELLWDVEAQKMLQLPLENAYLYSFTPDGRYAILDSETESLLWNIETQSTLSIPVESTYIHSFSPDSRYIILETEGRFVLQNSSSQIWDLETQNILQLPVENASVGGISPNGRYIILWTATESFVWDLQTQKIIRPPIETATIEPFSLTNHTVTIWNQSDGQQWIWYLNTQKIIELPKNTFISATDPEGRYVMLQRFGINSSLLWDVSKNQTWPLPIKNIVELRYSPDASYMVVRGEQGVYLWDVEKNQVAARFIHRNNFFSGFSPSGQYFLTHSEEAANIWLMDSEELKREACSRLTRNLTLDEWRQYIGDEEYQRTCSNLPYPDDYQSAELPKD